MYTTKALSIKQDKTGITIDYNEDIVINYLLDFLTTKDIHYTNKNNSIHITCDISESLIDIHKKHKHILPHELSCAVFRDLSQQLTSLEKSGFVLDHLYRKDTIVLNEGIFLYVGAHHIVSKDSEKGSFPDTMYQLGVYIIKLHFNKDVTKEKYILKKVIEPIYYTPLYWSLLRCTDKVSENRVLVYI